MPPKLQWHVPMGQRVLWDLLELSCKTKRTGAQVFSLISCISTFLSWSLDLLKFLLLIYALLKYFSNGLYSCEFCGD